MSTKINNDKASVIKKLKVVLFSVNLHPEILVSLPLRLCKGASQGRIPSIFRSFLLSNEG